MAFKVPNSSFIFDLRLLSMTLWAVFLAIFLPATLVELGCFLPAPLNVCEPVIAFLLVFFGPDCEIGLTNSSLCCSFGFI